MFKRPSETAVTVVMDPDSMRERTRFSALWQRCLGGGHTLAEAVHSQLIAHYGESHRYYHTLDHIRHCLSEFDQAVNLMDDPDTVEIALWFHDAIYRSGATDNERCSADLFQKWAKGHAEAAFRQQVDDLIMATTHRDEPVRWDQRVIVDIDLSGFGLPWKAFERNSRQLRAECAAIDDEVYYSGLLRFLVSLQSRPTFFLTEFFQHRYERTARDNIHWVIEDLRVRGYS